jgi:hypothetical protein
MAMRGGCRRAATDPLLPGRAIGRPCDGMVTVMSDSATGRVHRRVSSTLCHMAPKWEQLSYRVRTRLKLETFQAKGDRCWQCGAPATEPDHIIPVSAGGEHTGLSPMMAMEVGKGLLAAGSLADEVRAMQAKAN